MAAFNARAKPYKLKPSEGDKITRDDIATWSYTILACSRQVKEWRSFLPEAENSSWKCKSEDETYGLTVMKREGNQEVEDIEKSEELRTNFLDFLTFVATHCPSGFMTMIMRESTSFDWIMKQLQATYDLETRGEHFLAGNSLKFEFSPTFTYHQAFMMTKDFYLNSLLSKGTLYKGKPLAKNEELTPLAENFIVEKCLQKIDHRLLDHIKNTRGHLFTEERPTLACNQKILFTQIDSMLAEIEGNNSGDITINNVRTQYPLNQFRGFRNRGSYRGGRPPFRAFRPSGSFAGRNPQHSTSSRMSGCYKCLEAKRYDAAKFHSSRDCTFTNSRPQNNSGMRVLLVQDNQDLAPQTFPSVSQPEIQDWDSEHYNNPGVQEVICQDQQGDYSNDPVYYDAESSMSYYEPL